MQRCGNSKLIARHFDLFSSLLSCSPYTLYTAQFQFTGHSLDIPDNVLHDWLFPHHCIYVGFATWFNTEVMQEMMITDQCYMTKSTGPSSTPKD